MKNRIHIHTCICEAIWSCVADISLGVRCRDLPDFICDNCVRSIRESGGDTRGMMRLIAAAKMESAGTIRFNLC
jgi:hypothetical protein